MKQLTNFRTVLKDDATILHPPKVMTLEDAVEYIVDGEFVEITPDAIRVGMSKKQPKHPGLG
jgi:GTP-binding protein